MLHSYFLRDMCLERLAKGVWSQLNIGRHLIVPFLRMIIGLLVHKHCSYEIFSDFFFFFFSVNLMHKCIFSPFLKKKKHPALSFFIESLYEWCLWKISCQNIFCISCLKVEKHIFARSIPWFCAFSLFNTESLECYFKPFYFYQIWALIFAKKQSNIISPPQNG